MQNFLSAYKILDKVYNKNAYVNIALKDLPKTNSGLITSIVYGCLENDIKSQYIIKKLAKKVKDKEVNLILKIGIYSLLNLTNIPDYYIVNTLVNLAKKIGFSSASGLVNAVLKKVSKNEFSLPNINDKDYLSVHFSKPQWFLDMLVNNYGMQFVESLLNFKPKREISVRINQTLISIEQFKKLLNDNQIKFSDTALKNCLYVNYPKLLKIKNITPFYAVQGLSSVFCVDCFDIEGTEKVIDVCAAPGGKSIYLAEKLKNGSVTSCDLHPHRVDLIKSYAQNMGVKNIKTLLQDSTVFQSDLACKFDMVLCDVLCSGSGTFFDKPDVFLNKSEEDIKNLNKIQLQILENSSKYLKSGGQLIYSTCSILKEENDNIIEKFLSNNKNFIVEIPTNVPFEHVKTKGICLFPHVSNVDGFYVCKMRKL